MAALITQQAGEIARLTEQLRPGSPTERAPTQWAYDQACAALRTQRERSDALTVERDALRELALASKLAGRDLLYGYDQWAEMLHVHALVLSLIEALRDETPAGWTGKPRKGL